MVFSTSSANGFEQIILHLVLNVNLFSKFNKMFQINSKPAIWSKYLNTCEIFYYSKID